MCEITSAGWLDFYPSNMPAVLLGYYVLDKGYDKKAKWSFRTFKNSIGKSLGVRNVKESLPEQ